MEDTSHSPPAHLEEIDHNTDECGQYYALCYNYTDSIDFVNIASSDLSQPEDELPEEEWINDDDVSNSFKHDIEDSEPEDVTSVQDLPPQSLAIMRWLTLFLLSLQAAYHLSNRAINYLFRFLATLFLVLARYTSMFDFAQSFPPLQ